MMNSRGTGKRFVVVEGNIGAGKTTLVKLAGKVYDFKLVLEQFKENPFLPKFYADQSRYAFPLELSFLAERFQQHKLEIASSLENGDAVLCDYYFLKSYVFARMTLQGDELDLYKLMFDIMMPQLPKPDLYVYIHRPVPDLLRQIQKRGRPYEQGISPEYLERVENSYFSFFEEHPELPIVCVNAGSKDFESDECVCNILMELLEGKKIGTRKVVTL